MIYMSSTLTSMHTPCRGTVILMQGMVGIAGGSMVEVKDRMYRNERQMNGLKHIYQGCCDIVAQRCMRRHADSIDYLVEPLPQRCRLAEVVT